MSKNVYENCQVLNVHDGDTMSVNCQGEKIKVRLYCIDAPELRQEPWGVQSRDYLRSIIGPMVRLIVKDKDRYGRVVAEVFSRDNGTMNVNRQLIVAGFAAVYPKYCDEMVYYTATDSARVAEVGIWRAEGSQQRPWEWRHR